MKPIRYDTPYLNQYDTPYLNQYDTPYYSAKIIILQLRGGAYFVSGCVVCSPSFPPKEGVLAVYGLVEKILLVWVKRGH